MSSASILESATIGAISGIISFWLDKLFTLPSRLMAKVSTKKKEDENGRERDRDIERKVGQERDINSCER